MVIMLGVVLALAVDLAAAALSRRRGSGAAGLRNFLWVWLAITLADFGVGIAAGHGALPELAVHTLVFAVPAAVAFALARRRRTEIPSGQSTSVRAARRPR
jgi:hypothetical protein